MADTRSRELMTTEETAALVRMSPATLANQRSRGDGLPYVRLPGGRIRYVRETVQQWLDENTVTPKSRAD